MIEMREGDYVLISSNICLLRLHMKGDELIITSDEFKRMYTIATISDMIKMRDWLTRRLEEEMND